MGIDYSRYELSVKEKYGFLGVGYICICAVFYLFYHSLFFALISGLLVILFIVPFENWKAEKRRVLLITQFKDMLYSMSAYVATGVQIADALEGCLDNLKSMYDEKSPMVMELSSMVLNIRENKESEIRLLQDLANRSHCEDIDNFVQVYVSCTVTGGDLEKVLKNTIDILMDKINIEREIRTFTAQKKLEGNIITIMPVMVILFLNLFFPEYLSPLYTTVSGRVLMTGALIGLAAAHLMMRHLTGIEV